jgi:hypothetical protein
MTAIELGKPLSWGKTTNHFFKKAWTSESPRNLAFRELCVAVGKTWEEETGIPLPDIDAPVSTICFYEAPHPGHPLWLVLSALGISIDGRSMKEIVRYANTNVRPIGGVPDFINHNEVRGSDLTIRNVPRNM